MINVLILIVVEDGLVRLHPKFKEKIGTTVLILIVVEDGLVQVPSSLFVEMLLS